MSQSTEHVQTRIAEQNSKTHTGFWIYLMTDCILFASLFATFAVLRFNTYGGPSGKELFSMPFVLIETVTLLTSSFTAGLALLAAQRAHRTQTLVWLTITALFGLSFLTMELTEFTKLAHEGNSWQRSGFLSSFFTLVGTHGAHITVGLVWVGVLFGKLLRRGYTVALQRQVFLWTLFWHFLDIVWICIFTVVYLLGAA